MCELGAQESLPLYHCLVGVLAQGLSSSFTPGGFHLVLDSHSSPLGTLLPSVPRGWSTAAANRTQTLSAALKHKGSRSLEVFLGMFLVHNQGRRGSKTNKGGKKTVQKHQGRLLAEGSLLRKEFCRD